MATAYKEDIPRDDLDRLVNDLRRRADAIAGMVRRMQEEKTEKVHAQGMKGVGRGLAAIDKFILNCKRDLGEF